jgi:hypothetical protein
MALLTITFLSAAVAISGVEVIESLVLVLRKGQGTALNFKFAAVEGGFGLIALWEILDPQSDGSKSVAFVYVAYLATAVAVGYFLIRKSGWQFKLNEPIPPFPLGPVVLNLALVIGVFAYAIHIWWG